MRSWISLRNWFAVVLTGCALVADVAGCGGDNSSGLPPGDDSGGDVVLGDALGGGDADAAATRDADAAAKSDGDAAATSDADGAATADGDATTMGMGDADAGASGDGDATTMGMGDADAGATGDADATTTGDADAAATPDADAAATMDADAAATMDADAATADADAAPAMDADAAPFVCGIDGGDNSSCDNGGSKGLCKTNVCSPCTDTTDDTNCTAAYGTASLCLAGTCTPSDCRTNNDCTNNANGGFCGISTPNFCGKCTSDQQCAGNTTNKICNTTSGQCDPGLCSADAGINPGSPAACPVNPADICCGVTCQAGAGPFACCPGLLGDTYCTGKLDGGSATCTNNACTLCAGVTNYHFTVDPNNGSDQTGTGASQTGCAFKTITRALQVMGNSPPAVANPTITVLGASTVGPGESYPILVPANVTITTSTGAVTVNVPAGKAGFSLLAASSTITGGTGAALTIEGTPQGTAISAANSGTFGIVTGTGSASTTLVSNLTVKDFLNDGILVNDTGILSIGAGVTSTLNGSAATGRRAGLHVTGTGQAIINVPSGTPTHFDANSNHGILVDASGSITLTGSVTTIGPPATGTVTTNGNFAAGLWIQQRAGAPQNVINGLVSFASTNGNGMRFVTPSNVKLRNSVATGNFANGVLVSGVGAPPDDISKIDLGLASNPPDYGNNTLQAVQGSGNNGATGLCLQVRANAGTLNAAGNTFGTNNCANTAAALTISKGSCPAGFDLGLFGANNNIDTTKCTHP